MSYTESDVVENIYNQIKDDKALCAIIDILIAWYEKERSYYDINDWNTKTLDERIRLLKSRR